MIYTLGANEILRPAVSRETAPAVRDRVAACEGLPMGSLDDLPPVGGASGLDNRAVRLIMLDRLCEKLFKTCAPEDMTFLFVTSKQDRPDIGDTEPMWPLLVRWALARGVSLVDPPICSKAPWSWDAAFRYVLPEIERELTRCEPDAITIALGPGTTALGHAAVTAAFEGLRPRRGVAAVGLVRRDTTDTKVERQLLPDLMSARSLRQEARRYVDGWEFAQAAALLELGMEGSATGEARSLARSAAAYLRRDATGLVGRDPWPPELGEAGREAAHLVDLVEALWAEGRSDWEVALYLGLLVVEVLPAAWAESYALRQWERRLDWREVITTANADFPDDMKRAIRTAGTVGVECKLGLQRARVLLVATGPRQVPRRLPPDEGAYVWWVMAWKAVRQLRNDVAHVFAPIERQRLVGPLGSTAQREAGETLLNAEPPPSPETRDAVASFPADAFDPTGPGRSPLRRFTAKFCPLIAELPNRLEQARRELLGAL